MAWLFEISTHLVETLGNNLEINDTAVPVFYANPELDDAKGIAERKRPRVAVHLYNMTPNKEWLKKDYGTDLILEESDDTIVLSEKPLPYWLYFQISLLTDYQQNNLNLVSQISQLFPFRSHIRVGNGGEEDCLFMEQVEYLQPNREEFNVSSQKIRRFRSVFRYKVAATLPLSDNMREEYYKVTGRNIIFEDMTIDDEEEINISEEV